MPILANLASKSAINAVSALNTPSALLNFVCSSPHFANVSALAASNAVLSVLYANCAALNFVSISVPVLGDTSIPFSSSNLVPSADNTNVLPLSSWNEYNEPSNSVSASPFVKLISLPAAYSAFNVIESVIFCGSSPKTTVSPAPFT